MGIFRIKTTLPFFFPEGLFYKPFPFLPVLVTYGPPSSRLFFLFPHKKSSIFKALEAGFFFPSWARALPHDRGSVFF